MATLKFKEPIHHSNTVGLERAIKKFNKIVNSEGIMDELKKREYAMSPSQKRKEKQKRNEYRKIIEKKKLEKIESKRKKYE